MGLFDVWNAALPKPDLTSAVKHLRKADPILKSVIDEVGPCTLRPDRERFQMLVRSIISQQISTAAARSIRQKLEALTKPHGLTAASLSRFSAEELRPAGISPQKAGYLLDLVARVNDGRLELTQIGRLDDEAVIERLVQVKGIGRWTAQMFLIFSLGRLDVLPHDDLGVKTALKNLYSLDELPNKEAAYAVAACWRPYATVASWYCWRSLELGKSNK